MAISMASIDERFGEALAAHRRGALDEADALCRQILQLAPQSADALHLLGIIAHQRGDHRLAVERIGQAITADPLRAAFHNNLGEVYRALELRDDARRSYECAVKLDSSLAAAHYHLGLLAREENDRSAALRHFDSTVRSDPDHIDAIMACGDLQFYEGRFEAALASYQRAIAIRGEHAAIRWRRGLCFHRLRMVEPAISEYQQALRLNPREVDAHNHLAGLYLDMGRPDPAIQHVHQALAILPDNAELHGNLALMLRAQGRVEESIAASRRAVELNPANASLHSNLLYTLNELPGAEPAAVFAEHLAWAARHAEPLTVRAIAPARDRNLSRRLRIGYVSPYFRNHAVNYFSEPILASHDHAQFEVFCYSDVAAPDAVTDRLRPLADHWRPTVGLSDLELAEQVKRDQIDILVDLTGHIAGNRLLAFARKPAPTQVTYLGYQNTTGMSAMDYRLTDAWSDPPGKTDEHYTERLVRLPRAFFCYRPHDDAPPVSELPARTAGRITFGSFNSFNKVSTDVLTTWLEILKRVENSRLLVLAYRDGWVTERLHTLAREHGVEPARIELFDKCPTRDYYELMARADIALDPFPFIGHTTTCDAIWMGLPVVVLTGDCYAARFGGSALRNVGLDDLITSCLNEYVEAAVTLASQVDRLVELRGTLRERMWTSPLCDFMGFTRHLETEYRRMWTTWCGGGPVGTSQS